MNWDMVGAIAESIGAIGVIVSLLYLGTQIRQGNRTTQISNAHELNAATRTWWTQVIENKDCASIWRRGLIEPESLDPDEAIRFSVMLTSLATIGEEHFYARKDSDVTVWAGEALKLGQKDIAVLPGFGLWYRQRGHWFSQAFRADLEADINGHADKPTVSYYQRPDGSDPAAH